MSRVRSKDTKPELLVRHLVHGLGFRYRLHEKDLPGCPDLVFRGRRKVIWVHGCFWHGHSCPNGCRVPKSNVEFWVEKKRANVARDRQAMQSIRELGWEALVIWECELSDPELALRICGFLD